MLCPECLKKGSEIKLRVKDSRSQGAFETCRKYRCYMCKFETYNTEKLEDPACRGFEEENSD